MHVYATPAQFQRLREIMALEGVKSDDELRTMLVGQLSACVLDNGGDFDSSLARAGVNTEIRVLGDA
jgi:hypothetical protein